MKSLTSNQKNAKCITHVSFQAVHEITKTINRLVFACIRLNALKHPFLIHGLHMALPRYRT